MPPGRYRATSVLRGTHVRGWYDKPRPPAESLVSLQAFHYWTQTVVKSDASCTIRERGVPLFMDALLFPEDPSIPTIAWAAWQRLPIVVPWGKEVVSLGAGFDGQAQSPDSPFKMKCAFSPEPLLSTQRIFLQDTGGSYVESTTSSIGSMSQHTHMDVTARIGTSWFGGSGKGTYDAAALSSHNVSISHTCTLNGALRQ